jgi:pimeloyl-ACP methyl ester carboxylesterase
MKYAARGLRWFVGVLFALLALSMALTGNWLQAVPLVLLLFLLLPSDARFRQVTGRSPPWWARTIAIVLLLLDFVWLGSLTKYTSAIYKSPEVKARFMQMYAERMKTWPVPYEDVFVETEYGKVHVIVSGRKQAPPLVLLHVSGVASWSWQYNIKELDRHYRTYAIDTLGDAGRSELKSRGHYPADGKAQASLYSEIFDKLGIQSAYIVGGSEGGFIATNITLYAPKRVKKLVLLGPMGFGGTTESVLRIMLIQFFPLKSIQESTVRWAFGDNPGPRQVAGEWFRLMMTGTFPRKARPIAFTPERLEKIRVPVLLVLGKRDNLVGDAENTRRLAHNIPDVQIKVLETGHFMSVEQPGEVDRLIVKFLGT